MRDPDLVLRAERAAAELERAWDRWRTVHGFGTDPLPPVSSYVGYSLEEPWGQPRVVFGVGADEAELLAAVLNDHDCRSRAELDFRASVPIQASSGDRADTSLLAGASSQGDPLLPGEAGHDSEAAYQAEAVGHAEAAGAADDLGRDELDAPARKRRSGGRAAQNDSALPADWRRAASSRSRAGDQPATPRPRPATSRSRSRAQQSGSQPSAAPSTSAQAADPGAALVPDYAALPASELPAAQGRVQETAVRVHVASAPVIPQPAVPMAAEDTGHLGSRYQGMPPRYQAAAGGPHELTVGPPGPQATMQHSLPGQGIGGGPVG
ncbi:MAG TPA: hypothetical protein VGI58_20775 [Streptosporangiaceae bacterium]